MRRGVRHLLAGQQEQCRIERGTGGIADQIARELGVGIGIARRYLQLADRCHRRFEFDTLRDHARLVGAAGALARAGQIVGIAAIQAGRAALDVLHDEDRAVEGVELEVLEFRAERRDVQREAARLELGAEFIAVDRLRIELQPRGIGVAARTEHAGRPTERRAIEVVATGLIALGIGRVGQQAGDRLPRQDRSAGDLTLAEIVLQVERVELRRRIAGAGQRQDAADIGLGGSRHVGAGEQRREVRLLHRAHRVGVVEVRAEILRFMRVAAAQRQRDGVGDAEDVVREESVVLALLAIDRAIVADVVDGRQTIETGEHRRRKLTDTAERVDHGLTPSARETAWRSIVLQHGIRADVGDQAARRERAILRAELGVIDDPKLLVRIEAADQPVELALEGRALQACFLREGAELAIGIAVVGAARQVDIGVIDVACIARLIFAVRRDRGERGATEVPVGLERAAVIDRGVAIGLARGQRDFAVERVGRAARERIGRSGAAQDVDDRVGIADRHCAVAVDGAAVRLGRIGGRIEGLRLAVIGRTTAAFLAMRIIADQAEAEVGGRLEQQLPADEIAIAIVDAAFAAAALGHVLVEAVAVYVDTVDAEGERIGDRAGEAEREALLVVIAVGALGIAAEFEFRPARDDVDEAG